MLFDPQARPPRKSPTNCFQDRRKSIHGGSLTDVVSVRVLETIAESLPLRAMAIFGGKYVY